MNDGRFIRPFGGVAGAPAPGGSDGADNGRPGTSRLSIGVACGAALPDGGGMVSATASCFSSAALKGAGNAIALPSITDSRFLNDAVLKTIVWGVAAGSTSTATVSACADTSSAGAFFGIIDSRRFSANGADGVEDRPAGSAAAGGSTTPTTGMALPEAVDMVGRADWEARLEVAS